MTTVNMAKRQKRQIDARLQDEAPSRSVLFSRYVQRIIVETFSYCNRRCDFCPNALVPRTFDAALPDKAWQGLLRDLSNVGYARQFAFGRYHEPLSRRSILERVRETRSALPEAKILLNSNGDYLTHGYLAELAAAGADELKVMAYLPANAKFTSANAKRAALAILKRVGLDQEASLLVDQPDAILLIGAAAQPGLPKVTIRSENYSRAEFGCDRGGLLEHMPRPRRTQACYSPYFDINIDHTGDVVPCCNIRSDIPDHRAYILGNICRESIVDIFMSPAWRAFAHAVSGTPPALPPACAHCTYTWPQDRHFMP